MVDQAPEAVADELRAAATEADGGSAGGETSAAQASAEVMPANRPTFTPISLEQFWGLFVFVHMSGAMYLDSAALRMGPERPEAREACKALYETALETPALHWLINPANEQMRRWGAIVSYAFGLIMAVRSERAMKRAEARARGPIPKPGSERPPAEHRAPPPDGTLSDG